MSTHTSIEIPVDNATGTGSATMPPLQIDEGDIIQIRYIPDRGEYKPSHVLIQIDFGELSHNKSLFQLNYIYCFDCSCFIESIDGTAECIHQSSLTDECIICSSDINGVCYYSCEDKHIFHKDCLRQWVIESDKTTCPLCRKSYHDEQWDLL